MNCKVCGKKSESEYCFIHKPKKAIPKTKEIKNKTMNKYKIELTNNNYGYNNV